MKATENPGLSWAERVESIKAGGVGAIAAALGMAGLLLLRALFVQFAATHPNAPISAIGLPPVSLVSGAIGLFSGFLFGITYRYIVRQDRNPHLKSGAVGAFGLVRGFAAVEHDLQTWRVQDLWALLPVAIALGESLLLFVIARWLLEIGFSIGWLQRMGGTMTPLLPTEPMTEPILANSASERR